METYFENIKERILKEINSAEFIIYAAVAWITDSDVIELLISKMKSGIQVELIINDDDRFVNRKIQFDKFRKAGGRLFLYKNDNKSIMHNKFCVIDLSTTITGSYNWSFSAATLHKENIIIGRGDLSFAREFANEFKKIKKASILFEGQRNNYDMADYGIITHIHLEEDFHMDNCPGKKLNDKAWTYFCVDIEQGNKCGYLQFELSNETERLMITGNKIFGFWKEESYKTVPTRYSDLEKKVWGAKDDEGGKEIMAYGNKALYGFECLDPNFIKHLYHNCKGKC